MDISTVLGLVLGALALLLPIALGEVLDGIRIGQFIAAEPIVIIVLGTLGAGLISQPLEAMKALPKTFRISTKKVPQANGEQIATIVRLAEKARREGLLSLEEEIAQLNDPFLQKGMQLVIDGT